MKRDSDIVLKYLTIAEIVTTIFAKLPSGNITIWTFLCALQWNFVLRCFLLFVIFLVREFTRKFFTLLMVIKETYVYLYENNLFTRYKYFYLL